MRFVIFTHSLVSDWNHGNAHFLRGISTELISRGHTLSIYEPKDSWSRQHLVEQEGQQAITGFHLRYPELSSTTYCGPSLDLDQVLFNANVVLVHEWNNPDLISRIGAHRAVHGSYTLLFHDTHHRSLTDQGGMSKYDLRNFDGVLAYGEVIRKRYLSNGWNRNAWTWHEAADTRIFHPLDAPKVGDVVWIGNWGDNERADTLREYLIHPVRDLNLKATIYGVRYPAEVLAEMAEAGIEYGGWLPNYRVPEIFAQHRVTVHVPRGPYVRALPGIPTIRPFEALACGIPLLSAPWQDSEHLFTPGADFLFAQCGSQMRDHMQHLLSDKSMSNALTAHGLKTIQSRHTCAHRVDELLQFLDQ